MHYSFTRERIIHALLLRILLASSYMEKYLNFLKIQHMRLIFNLTIYIGNKINKQIYQKFI